MGKKKPEPIRYECLEGLPVPAVCSERGVTYEHRLSDSENANSSKTPAWLVFILVVLFVIPLVMLLVVVAIFAVVIVLPIMMIFPSGRRKIRSKNYGRRHPCAVEIDRNPVAPGELVQGVLHLLKPGPAERIEINLICEEHITYRQGTNTYHDEKRVEERTLATFDEQDLARRPSELRFQFEFPIDAMHSFYSSNNRLSWSIEVVREYANASPVKTSAYFQVLPIPLIEGVLTERLNQPAPRESF
ncbi:MAG: hypothetical protein AAGB34_10495 [Planctomycetota bacterium]